MGYQVNLNTTINLSTDFKTFHKKQVAFTHGAFDLFHAGHSLFLNKSKPKDGILIVGLEPDSNIKKYKSKLRPIVPLEHRMEILLNHRAVDFVFSIEELERIDDEYYQGLYKRVRPSLVTFGRNFAAQDVRIKQKTDSIKFRKIDDEVSSTTKIISSILNRYQHKKINNTQVN